MSHLVPYPKEVTTEDIITALRLHCEEWKIDQAEVDRLARQITEQREKRETIQ